MSFCAWSRCCEDSFGAGFGLTPRALAAFMVAPLRSSLKIFRAPGSLQRLQLHVGVLVDG
jgi:hypothetical protein